MGHGVIGIPTLFLSKSFPLFLHCVHVVQRNGNVFLKGKRTRWILRLKMMESFGNETTHSSILLLTFNC